MLSLALFLTETYFNDDSEANFEHNATVTAAAAATKHDNYFSKIKSAL